MQLNRSISLPRLCLSTQSGDQSENETIGQALLTAGAYFVFTLSALLTDCHFTSESGPIALIPKISPAGEGLFDHVSPKIWYHKFFNFLQGTISHSERVSLVFWSVNHVELLLNAFSGGIRVNVCMLLVGALVSASGHYSQLRSRANASSPLVGTPLLSLSLASKYV